jgi:peptidylprolyl isomerase
MIWLARCFFSVAMLAWAMSTSWVASHSSAQEPDTEPDTAVAADVGTNPPVVVETGNAGQVSPASPTAPASNAELAAPPLASPGKIGSAEAGQPEDMSPEEYRKVLMQDPEYVAELDKRAAAYKKTRANLATAIADQRETFVRYLNRDVRTPAARTLFFEQRNIVQQRLDENYEAALNLTMIGEYNEDAITFLVTMIQHRFENSIYDSSTLRGATFLMDNNSQLEYIWKAAARSAVTTGQFETARKIYDVLTKPEVLGDKEFNDTDAALRFFLDEHEKKFKQEMEIREKEAADDNLPQVLLKTTQGDVVIELYINQAPSAVSHFIKLVENGFYEELDFQLVIQDMLALSGDPAGDGLGNSGEFIKDEHQRADARHGLRGSLIMAKIPQDDAGNFFPDSGSSQFTILLLPVVSASEKQTVFGRVIKGMNAISRLRRVDPNKKKEKGEIVQPPDSIIQATVLRRPETLPQPVYAEPARTPQR